MHPQPAFDLARITGADEYLRTVAISPIFLDNVQKLQSSWVEMGMKVGQIGLRFGCRQDYSLIESTANAA